MGLAFDAPPLGSHGAPVRELLPALRVLDGLLGRALEAARGGEGRGAANPYRGLYISQDEVERQLSFEPCAPLWPSAARARGEGDAAQQDSPRLALLRKESELTSFDLDVLLVALAPDLDLRYEQLYAFLQDSVTRKRATVNFALDLLCPTVEEKLARRVHFAPDAPLVARGLLQLIPDPSQVSPPLLSHFLKVDEQVVRFILGQRNTDARLTAYARVSEPAAALDDPAPCEEAHAALLELVGRARAAGRPLNLYFHGPHAADKRRAAEALAAALGLRLLHADLPRAAEAAPDFRQALELLLREALYQDAILYLEGLDELPGGAGGSPRRQLLEALASASGVNVVSGAGPHAGETPGALEFVPVGFARPDFGGRRAVWERQLARRGVELDGRQLDALAGRFRLGASQIEAAVASASGAARWREAATTTGRAGGGSSHFARPEPRELFAAARSQSGGGLSALASKIEPQSGWDDIVLPPAQMSQLREVCERAAYGHVVYGDWGFARRLSHGRGLNVLFTGPPGTGKTTAAEVVARELELDLYKIDLSQVVSKYIGETEKNLSRIFEAAESSHAILFFDEADALFGKRSEVKDAHDRFANIEIGYLLQKMEEFDGIAVLATNLRRNMDDAFVRRLQIVVEFPFPDEEYRRRIWETIFPAETPLAPDVDAAALARGFKVSGGNIRNIALAGAFYAAADGEPVAMKHLLRAARWEFEKIGRAWTGVGAADGGAA